MPIHSQLSEIVASRVTGRSPDEFLFGELEGSSKGLVKRFARYRASLYGKSADIGQKQADKTFHSLRHAFVTDRLQAGCDLYLVQSVVGHVLQGVTLANYHHGATIEQLSKVVEVVSLPTDAASLFMSSDVEDDETQVEDGDETQVEDDELVE